MPEETTAPKSIIDPKYRDKYKGEKDWLSKFIDDNATTAVMKTKVTKAEDGSETSEEIDTGKRQLDLDKLFDLADANGIDARGRYGEQVSNAGAPGRLRMTVGNMLRAAARKRHGLNDINGEWNDADAAFIGDSERSEERDGSKIAKAKAEKEAEAA